METDGKTSWERITSNGRLVYWRLRLPDRRWVAVTKPAGSRYWQWDLFSQPGRPPERTVSGFDLSRNARDAADALLPELQTPEQSAPKSC